MVLLRMPIYGRSFLPVLDALPYQTLKVGSFRAALLDCFFCLFHRLLAVIPFFSVYIFPEFHHLHMYNATASMYNNLIPMPRLG
jgi:hypothetical protein